MFGIIGSGFGLYGHLPAIMLSGSDPVLIPERYSDTFKKRSELARFEKRISWAKDDKDLLQKAESLTVSTWPLGQEAVIRECLSYDNISALILEKPIAVSPAISADLTGALIRSGKSFRINYSFLNAPWYLKLAALVNNHAVKSIKISWSFMAHHYRHNLSTWKKEHINGGGAIRFYGIHFIALLCALNFNKIAFSATTCFSEHDYFKWNAQFNNAAGTPFIIDIDCYAQSQSFNIEVLYAGSAQDETLTIRLAEPFADVQALYPGLDARVSGLMRLYASLKENEQNAGLYAMYTSVNSLWTDIEHCNTVQPV